MEARAELRRRLREADSDELDLLLEERAEELVTTVVEQIFRNPFLLPRHVEALVRIPGVASGYGFRRELVGHPRTPRPLALQHLTGLYWADLVRVGTDTRLHPLVRRAADRRLAERLPGLATGERIAIARRASAAVVAALRREASPRVFAALLENPRLTEGQLAPAATDEGTSPKVLALLAAHPRWGARVGLRRALCRNPATPVASQLALLPKLSPAELRAVARDPRLAAAVRRRADELVAGDRRR